MKAPVVMQITPGQFEVTCLNDFAESTGDLLFSTGTDGAGIMQILAVPIRGVEKPLYNGLFLMLFLR